MSRSSRRKKIKSGIIYCCGCEREVQARLTDGKEIYPHREDLHNLPFWKCDECGGYVGCHYKTDNPTYPLGYLATKEMMNARRHIHRILDPLWQGGKYSRAQLYAKLTKRLGWKYHTASIKTIEEARKAYKEIQVIAAE